MPGDQALAVLNALEAERAELAIVIAQAAIAANPRIDQDVRENLFELWRVAAGRGAYVIESEDSIRAREEREQREGLMGLRALAMMEGVMLQKPESAGKKEG